MLLSLAVRDVVLIERLDLGFQPGLSVLTGETGAGKSILLDALGLALGERGDAALVRGGEGRSSVTAEFAVTPDSPALAILDAHGLPAPEPGEPLILRRVLGADGRSRAFVNDEPASVGALRALGGALVEIEGQFASRGLLDQSTHRDALDAFGRHGALRAEVASCHAAWRKAAAAREDAETAAQASAAEQDYLRHVSDELEALAPTEGEETELAATRTLLMHGEQLAEALSEGLAGLTETDGAETRIAGVRRLLVRIADKAGGRLDAVIEALDRATDAVSEASALLHSAASDLDADPTRLERTEERLFALRAAARKHRTDVDSLPALLKTFQDKLAAIESTDETLARLAEAEDEAAHQFEDAAARLGAARRKAAQRLDKAVMRELPPLKLEKAVFRTEVTTLPREAFSAAGSDQVAFMVSPNPGLAPGPLARIASGGELARFMLALKLVLNETGAAATLVFDEVDSGVGGATAAAVGERLRRLAETHQVLVVTHSPQVAALGRQHLRIAKQAAKGKRGGTTVTTVDPLDDRDRREEIARMLAGELVTDEARAAADSLIAGAAA